MQVGYYYHYALPFTALFAAISGCILIYLTYNITALRRKHKVPYGEIKTQEFQRKNGALNNFAMYTPFFLMLFALAELGRTNCGILFFLGSYFILASVVHIHSLYAFEVKQKSYRLRVFSMTSTFFVIIALSAINLYIAVHHF